MTVKWPCIFGMTSASKSAFRTAPPSLLPAAAPVAVRTNWIRPQRIGRFTTGPSPNVNGSKKADAKMREVKMNKHYSFTRRGFIVEKTTWNIAWGLDGNGSVSNIRGCVIKTFDAM